jgi:ankyrin repeat protein
MQLSNHSPGKITICIKMLLDHGADINAVDDSGKTVLHAALESYGYNYDYIKMLLDC